MLQLEVDMSPSSNGRDKMNANGIEVLVRLQIEVGISPFPDG
jgi:hypothetical protein